MKKYTYNIFGALAYRRTAGIIMEFSLWCAVCFAVLMSMIAAIVGKGNITWIMLLIFSIGLGVLMAFRLKAISMLYGVSVFHFLTAIIHFVCFKDSGGFGTTYSPLNIILFILLFLLSIAIITCMSIHAFTKYNLGNVVTIMMIVDSALTMILHILMYAAGFFGDYAYSYNESLRYYLNGRGYWVGTITFWIVLIVVMLLYIFSFWGRMEGNGKILRSYSYSSVRPGIQGVNGTYAGQIVYTNGGLITIGSDAGMTLRINDTYVSGNHCTIRFNTKNGFYEIYDSSKNGVYLQTGQRIQSHVFNSVRRGSVICIGSKAQQFKLL